VVQAAAYLGLSEGEFLERIELGVFPPGSPSNMREAQWHWQVIQGLSWTRNWSGMVYAEKKRKRHAAKKEKRSASGDTKLGSP
jgi:hypothetical protein